MFNDPLNIEDSINVSVGRGGDLNDSLKITGRLLIEVFGEDGLLRDMREVDNLVVTAGKNHIAASLSSAGTTAMGWMELGTGVTAAAAGDTLLGTFIASSRVALTSRTAATNVVTYVGDWAAGVATNAAITEAGIFNVVTANTITMLSRAVFTAINKGASDSLKITWTCTIG